MFNYNVLLCREQQLNHWFEMSPKENITNGQNWIRLEWNVARNRWGLYGLLFTCPWLREPVYRYS